MNVEKRIKKQQTYIFEIQTELRRGVFRIRFGGGLILSTWAYSGFGKGGLIFPPTNYYLLVRALQGRIQDLVGGG